MQGSQEAPDMNLFGRELKRIGPPTISVEFDHYAVWTDKVAKYPPTAEPFYLALGIADEVGEALAAMGTDNFIPELGDCGWYLARYITRVLDIRFSVAVETAKRLKFEGSLTRHTGSIAGIEKKRIRDGETWSDEKRAEKASAALYSACQILSWMLHSCKRKGITLQHVLALNIQKLSARLEAGTIQGDGDKR